MRRFEFCDATSRKFWEVDVRGKTLTVRFGKLGTDGQIKEKKLASENAAEAARDALVREKVGKGYIEIGKSPMPRLPDLGKTRVPKSGGTSATKAASGSIVDLWNRLEAWGQRAGAPPLGLRKGASERAIAAAEKKMSLAFPADFRESLLAHDGQDEPDDSEPHLPWLCGCSRLQPLSAIVERWSDECGMDDGQDEEDEGVDQPDDKRLLTDLHHERRIPVAGSDYWDGDNTYIDLAPGSKGTAGQVMTFTSECDRTVLGRSFRGALERYVALLESGALVWNAQKGVVPKGKRSWSDNPAAAFAKMKTK